MRGSTLLLATFGAACALGAAGGARAESETNVLNVPDDYPTIQAALDSAPKEFAVEIYVAAGTYREAVFGTGFESVKLVGATGAVIAPTTAEPAVSLCTCRHVEVAGFTLNGGAVGLDLVNVADAVAHDLRIIGSADAGVAASAPEGGRNGHFHYGHIENGPATTTALDLVSCEIAACGGDGVRASGATNVLVRETRIDSPSRDGIRAEGADAWVSATGTTILNAGEDGVHAEDAVVQLRRTTIRHAARDGVSFAGSRDAVAAQGVYDCVIEGAGDAGISAVAAAVTVEGGSIARTGGDGVSVGARATVTIARTTVTDCGGGGIVARVGGVIAGVMGVSVTGAVGDGISGPLTGWATNVAVTDVGGAGIAVTTPVNAVGSRIGLEGDSVRRTGGVGISFTATGEVRGNVVEDAGAEGLVVIAGRGAVVHDNDVSSSTGDGLSVSGDGVEASFNTIRGAGGDGLVVGGRGAKVRDNEISDAAGDGIELRSARGASVQRNDIEGCDGCGLRLDGDTASAKLDRNVVKGAGELALFEDDGRGTNRIGRSNKFDGKSRRRHRRTR